jgi:short-subunit dehydrogenase
MKTKNILLLGSTGELGFFLLNELYNRNYNLIYSYKTKKKNKLLKIDKNKKNLLQGFKCDLSKEKDIKKLINLSFKKLKNIDYVINCTGVFYYDKFKNINYKDLSHMFKINCFSTMIINKNIFNKKNKKDIVKIITCGSSSATMGSKDTVAYCASKHALLGTVKSLNQTYTQDKIFNYCLNFGTLDNKKGKLIKNIKNQNLINQSDILESILYILTIGSIGVPEDLYLKRFN